MALNLPALFGDDAPARLKFAVVGWPLSYTLSPAIHTAAFKAAGVDAVYKAVPVRPEEWSAFLTQAKALPLDGFNVTVPYKELILTKGNHPIPWDAGRCEQLGAVNTVRRTPTAWSAYNTDVGGLQDDFRRRGLVLGGGVVVILGAGGAARAAVSALVGLPNPPRTVWVLNRTADKARELAQAFTGGPADVRAGDMEQGAAACREAALIINATSLGLSVDDPSPADPAWFRRGMGVYDMIYHRETTFMRKAREAGAQTMSGLGMLVHQGARSFEIWLNKRPPVDAMRRAAMEELKVRSIS